VDAQDNFAPTGFKSADVIPLKVTCTEAITGHYSADAVQGQNPMTKEEQLAAVDSWCAAMRERIASGIEKGGTGWLHLSFGEIWAELAESYHALIQSPSMELAARAALAAFMLQAISAKEAARQDWNA
jgi:hypothetical protein